MTFRACRTFSASRVFRHGVRWCRSPSRTLQPPLAIVALVSFEHACVFGGKMLQLLRPHLGAVSRIIGSALLGTFRGVRLRVMSEERLLARYLPDHE